MTYKITANFPKEEIFGLRNTMRKTSIDVPAYIAEGCGKSNDAEFARSMSAAFGFLYRLEYYALMARDLEFLPAEIYTTYQDKIVEVRMVMSGFNRRLIS